MNSAIKEALAQVEREEHRLLAEQKRIATELGKVRAVRRVLSEQAGISLRPNLAPPGALPAAILSVLDRKTPKSRGQIIEAIRKAKYAYSLTPLHVTKHLIRLLKAKKVRRVGEGVDSGYLLK